MRQDLMRIATDATPPLSQIATEDIRSGDQTSQGEGVGVGEEVTTLSARSRGNRIQNVVP